MDQLSRLLVTIIGLSKWLSWTIWMGGISIHMTFNTSAIKPVPLSVIVALCSKPTSLPVTYGPWQQLLWRMPILLLCRTEQFVTSICIQIPISQPPSTLLSLGPVPDSCGQNMIVTAQALFVWGQRMGQLEGKYSTVLLLKSRKHVFWFNNRYLFLDGLESDDSKAKMLARFFPSITLVC